MIYIPDTNILIYALKGVDPYATWIFKRIEDNQLAISVIVVAEFLSGANKDEEAALKRLLSKTNMLPIDFDVAEAGANYKKIYSQKTKKVWLTDCLIAATCKVNGAVLVTNNKKDFPMTDIKIQML